MVQHLFSQDELVSLPQNPNAPLKSKLQRLNPFLDKGTTNNTKRNGSILKNHSELHNYQIIHSSTYTHRKPNCTSSNIEIFLSNVPFPQNYHAIDDLPSNHLPIVLSLTTQHNAKGQHQTEQTDWGTFAKNCNRFQINQKLTTITDIDNEIETLTRLIQRFFRNAMSKTPNDQSSSPNTVLQNLIKERNKHRQKCQKTGNLFTSYIKTSSQISSANISQEFEIKYGRTSLQPSRRRTTYFGRPSRLPAPKKPRYLYSKTLHPTHSTTRMKKKSKA